MLRVTDVLLVLLLIYHLILQAEVAPGITITARDEDTSSSKRTLFNIIWGCVTTTIICAWAAIHPNIPPREGPFKRTLRRLELMFWTIVAPEILPCWALNQLLAAITVRDVYNEGKGYETKKFGIWETVKRWFSLQEIKEEAGPVWTVAHGYFLIMGGFHVVEPQDGNNRSTEANTDTQGLSSINERILDMEKGQGPSENKLKGRVTILTLELLRVLVKDPEFKILMTEEEISDRSKGDALSKLIFITQSTWFILQCLGRRVQGLDLTQLELTTLALASLNAITFALWWDKPLGAQTSVRVYLNRKLTDSEREPQEHHRSMRSEMITSTQEAFQYCVTILRDVFLCQSERNIFVSLLQVPFAVLLLLLLPIFSVILAFYATLNDLVESASCHFPPDDTHVPSFYVPKHRYPKRYHVILLLSLGALFGGIHCSGWNFRFPTYVEQQLWRFASLAVTIIPIMTLPFVFILTHVTSFLSLTNSTFETVTVVLGLMFCALAYVSARLILLGLALSLLRHLSPTAFIPINWTKFYPHFL